MNKTKNKMKTTDFDDYLAKELENPAARKLFMKYKHQLEISYKILQTRKQKGLSQAALAKKIGTNQSNVARIESGQQNVTIKLLDKIAFALDMQLEVSFK